MPLHPVRRVYANTAVKGEIAADNSLYLGSYSAAKDGAVVFSGVGHEFDDENYLATRVSHHGRIFGTRPGFSSCQVAGRQAGCG